MLTLQVPQYPMDLIVRWPNNVTRMKDLLRIFAYLSDPTQITESFRVLWIQEFGSNKGALTLTSWTDIRVILTPNIHRSAKARELSNKSILSNNAIISTRSKMTSCIYFLFRPLSTSKVSNHFLPASPLMSLYQRIYGLLLGRFLPHGLHSTTALHQVVFKRNQVACKIGTCESRFILSRFWLNYFGFRHQGIFQFNIDNER